MEKENADIGQAKARIASSFEQTGGFHAVVSFAFYFCAPANFYVTEEQPEHFSVGTIESLDTAVGVLPPAASEEMWDVLRAALKMWQ